MNVGSSFKCSEQGREKNKVQHSTWATTTMLVSDKRYDKPFSFHACQRRGGTTNRSIIHNQHGQRTSARNLTSALLCPRRPLRAAPTLLSVMEAQAFSRVGTRRTGNHFSTRPRNSSGTLSSKKQEMRSKKVNHGGDLARTMEEI